MARLLLLTGGDAKSYELTRDEVTVGRLPECEIHLDSNMISRKHARLIRNGSSIVVEDLGSGNGTFVNGQRITTPTTLHHDDRVKFGPLLMRFEGDSPSPRSRPQAPPEPTGVEFGADDDSSTIMGAAAATSGFGCWTSSRKPS